MESPSDFGESQGGRPRGPFRLMVDPVFGPLFWGKIFSASAMWIHNIVAVILAFRVSGSGFQVGLVVAVQFTPQLLFALASGRIADRGHLPLQMATGRILAGLGSSALAMWIWATGGIEALSGIAPILVSSFVVGVGIVVGGPAMQAILPSLVRPGEMAAAMAINTVPMTLARASGPILGAAIAVQLGPVAAFAGAGAVNLAYGGAILALRLPSPPKPDRETELSVRAAVQHVNKDHRLVVLLVATATLGVGTVPSLAVSPVLARELSQDAGLVGWLASSFGVGVGIGFLLFDPISRRIRNVDLGRMGLFLMVAGLGVTTVGLTPEIAMAGFCLSGLGMTLAFTSITAEIQERAPVMFRGRIMSIWVLAFFGSRFFAGVGIGAMVEVSVKAALISTAVVLLVAAHSLRRWPP